MYRQKFLKHGIISTGLLMSIFFWNAGTLRADTPEAPLLPMNVEFRYVPQYLDESIPDDPRYARIQALLDEDGCHVILLDKTTDREAFYSTSKRRVDTLAANGSDAYITPLDFTASLPKDASPSFLIHFQDRFGNEVSWKFFVGRMVPHASPRRSPAQTIPACFSMRSAAQVQMVVPENAGREYLPKSTQSADARRILCDRYGLGQIMPGTGSGPSNVVHPI
jgi:hypothetical protein